ncbi:MAG: DsrE family protein [Bacteroidales bacterium]|nr:DsrE family protein [Bacteroidales bacterium]
MSKLHLLWTTGEKEVAMKVIFPYLINSKANGWWDEINLIIWGPSARLTAGDQEIHSQLQDIMDSGITVEACQACSDAYRVTEKLIDLGITVRYMGGSFSEYLNSEAKVITF